MFGGFPLSFYDEYHRHRPKSEPVEEYSQRAILYELFHHLNHTVLFGVSSRCQFSLGMSCELRCFLLGQSGYAGGAIERMKKLLRFMENAN